jgi:hypothetical protein
MRAEVRQKINAILNAEQQKRYARSSRARPGAPAGGGAGRVYTLVDGKPTEVAIRTGLTDGNATEVVSGPLTEGQEVIVGTQLPASGAPKGGTAPRLPF